MRGPFTPSPKIASPPPRADAFLEELQEVEGEASKSHHFIIVGISRGVCAVHSFRIC